MFLGAMLGGMLGAAMQQLMPGHCSEPGAYALVGMGAVVAATTHAPLTAIMMIFEMTGDYKIIPALMSACVLSCFVATRIKATSIYTEKLARRGSEYLEPVEFDVLKKMPVTHVITREPVVVTEDTPFPKLVDLVVHTTHTEFFVTQKDGGYVGTISVHQIRQVILDGKWLDLLIIASDVADRTYPVLRPTDSLDLAMHHFTRAEYNELPVVYESKLVGSVRKSDVLDVRRQELMRRDLSGYFLGSLKAVRRTKFHDLGEGYVVAEMEAPPHFVDRTLRELDVRVAYGVEVILIRRADMPSSESTVVPSSTYRIQAGDNLLIAGKPDRVRKLSY